jgi:hypothetical protein
MALAKWIKKETYREFKKLSFLRMQESLSGAVP